MDSWLYSINNYEFSQRDSRRDADKSQLSSEKKPMRQFAFGLFLLAAVAAQSDGMGGEFCNYTATGDEVVENAVPIATFRTSGANATRRGWCIAYCQDRTSLKATMLFQPAAGAANGAKYRHSVSRIADEKIVSTKQTKGFPLNLDSGNPEDMFCIDPSVASTFDFVFKSFTGIDTLTAMLAQYVNKPGWAYLVYEYLPDTDSLVSTENAMQDNNFCSKMIKQTAPNGDDLWYQVFCGQVMFS